METTVSRMIMHGIIFKVPVVLRQYPASESKTNFTPLIHSITVRPLTRQISKVVEAKF